MAQLIHGHHLIHCEIMRIETTTGLRLRPKSCMNNIVYSPGEKIYLKKNDVIHSTN